VLVTVKSTLMEIVDRIGFEGGRALIEQERARLCGPRALQHPTFDGHRLPWRSENHRKWPSPRW
jgi:hypothetical protein